MTFARAFDAASLRYLCGLCALSIFFSAGCDSNGLDRGDDAALPGARDASVGDVLLANEDLSGADASAVLDLAPTSGDLAATDDLQSAIGSDLAVAPADLAPQLDLSPPLDFAGAPYLQAVLTGNSPFHSPGTFGLNVTVAFPGGTPDPTATGDVFVDVLSATVPGDLHGQATATLAGGAATFTGLGVTRAGTYTLRVTSASYAPGLVLLVVHGGAGKFVTQPVPATVPTTQTVQYAVVDEDGAIDVDYASLDFNPASVDVHYSGNLFTPPQPVGPGSNGLYPVTFTATRSGGYYLKATYPFVAISDTFTVSSGPPTRLELIQSGGDVLRGKPITQPIQFGVYDAGADQIAVPGLLITIASQTPGEIVGTLSATTNTQGVASFPGLTFTTAGIRQLTVSASGYPTFETTVNVSPWDVRNTINYIGKRVVVDPASSDHLLAFAFGSSVESGNGGTSWSPVAGPTNTPCDATYDPNPTSGRAYLSTTGTSSLWVSEDAGHSFAPIPGPGTGCGVLAVAPTSSSIIYWITGGHLWRTGDQAATWADMGTPPATDVIRVDAANLNSIYVAATSFASYNGPWHSMDGGATWTEIDPVPFSSRTRLGITTHPSAGGTIDVVLADTSGPADPLWVSADSGGTWGALGPPSSIGFAVAYGVGDRRYTVSATEFRRLAADGTLESQQSLAGFNINSVQGVVVAPSDRSIVYVLASSGLFRSISSGD